MGVTAVNPSAQSGRGDVKLYASGPELVALEAELSGAEGLDRAPLLVALAWHLRQRDSARSLALSAQAEALLPGAGLDPALARALMVRSALSKCEIAALQCQLELAETLLLEARHGLLALNDAALEADALLAEALLAKAKGERERELMAFAQCVQGLASAADRPRLTLARAWQAYEAAFTEPDRPDDSEGDDASEGPERPPPLLREAIDAAAEAMRLSRREPARAAGKFLHASGLARQFGLVRHAVICAVNAGTALQGLGDFEQAAACYEDAASTARATGWPVLIGTVQTCIGNFLQELGQLEESRGALADALTWLAPAPRGINKANACSALANTLLALGRGIEAVGPMNEAILMYREARSTDNLALNLIGHARALSAAGLVERALDAIAEARELIAKHAFPALEVGICEALAEIHARHELPPPPDLRLPSPALHYLEAVLDTGQRIAGWKAPATLFVRLADEWARAGDLRRAYEYARRAIVTREQETILRMRHPLAVLLLRHHGASLSADPADAAGTAEARLDAPAASPGLLTPREREVVQMLARSYSNKEIAIALRVSEQTVKWHLKRIFAKLNAGSRKHAVTRARALGVVRLNS